MQTDLFHPEKLLGSGPAAKVYCGVEAATGRKVLIKSLLAEHETPHAPDRERLQLLAPALMQMRHPQIAGLITLLPTESEFAIVSEFMPGVNIRTLAAARQVQAADLRALALQFMHALLVGEHLRQPHGDPKPGNVIIAENPAGGLFLHLQDWGLSLTRQFHPPETLWFRAPELHRGGMPTSQSDLFTAAASLFCLATNSAPAQSEVAEELIHQWQSFHAVPALQHLRPDLDQPLRDWLAWLMQPDPRLRPQCVAHALDALMVTMHTGFIHMPQQAPQMMPGAQAMPLVTPAEPSPPAATAAQQHASAPRPRPVARPAAQTHGPAQARPLAKKVNESDEAISAAVALAEGKATAPKKRPVMRVLAAVTLNLAALVLAGFFFWPAVAGQQRGGEGDEALTDASATAPLLPATDAAVAAQVGQEAKPAATPAPAAATKAK